MLRGRRPGSSRGCIGRVVTLPALLPRGGLDGLDLLLGVGKLPRLSGKDGNADSAAWLGPIAAVPGYWRQGGNDGVVGMTGGAWPAGFRSAQSRLLSCSLSLSLLTGNRAASALRIVCGSCGLFVHSEPMIR